MNYWIKLQITHNIPESQSIFSNYEKCHGKRKRTNGGATGGIKFNNSDNRDTEGGNMYTSIKDEEKKKAERDK